MTPISGIVPPLCTSFDGSGALDEPALEGLVRHQLDAGVHGIFALGSSGEAIYLDDRTRARVLDVVVGSVSGAVPVLAGALAGSTARTIEQVGWVTRRTVDAIVVTAPFYADVSDAETVTHFEMVAAASSVPVIAYDIPGNVGRKLSADVSIELLGRGVLAGLKDTSGDMPGFLRILAALGSPRHVALMTGSDRLAAAALAAGADGIVPGLGNVSPDLFVDLYAAHLAGDTASVERLQADIAALSAIFAVGARHGLARHAAELGALKVLLHRDGLITSPRLSPPLAAFPPEAAAEVTGIAEAIGR